MAPARVSPDAALSLLIGDPVPASVTTLAEEGEAAVMMVLAMERLTGVVGVAGVAGEYLSGCLPDDAVDVRLRKDKPSLGTGFSSKLYSCGSSGCWQKVWRPSGPHSVHRL